MLTTVLFSTAQFLPGLPEGRPLPVFLLGDPGDCVHRGHKPYQSVLHGISGGMLLLPLVWTGASIEATQTITQTLGHSTWIQLLCHPDEVLSSGKYDL